MGWQVTATTLYCDAIADWVTVLVYKDGHTGCGHFAKFGEISRKSGDKMLVCKGPDSCQLCAEYKEDVLRRETNADEG